MNVFLTGATGYVGGAVLSALLQGGNTVTCLARSEDSAGALEAAGATPVLGDLEDPGSYLGAARECTALIHAAMVEGDQKVPADRTAVETLLTAAAEGEAEIVVYTSGCWVLGDTGDEAADERAATDHPPEIVAWRPDHEARVLNAANGGLATSVVRPGMVYGGRRGLVSALFQKARDEGAPSVVGNGRNRWSPVHRDDVGALYRLVVEMEARGVYHAVDGSSPTVLALAEAASRLAGTGEVHTIPGDDARRDMGPLADALCLDQVMAAPRSHKLGWAPERGPLLDEMEAVYAEWEAATQRST